MLVNLVTVLDVLKSYMWLRIIHHKYFYRNLFSPSAQRLNAFH